MIIFIDMKIILVSIAALLLIAGGYYWYVQEEKTEMFDVDNESEEVFEEDNQSAQGKLDINVVCEGALAYMSFPDGESADNFVSECKAGEHPEVIERYKADMNLGDGATI